MSTSTGKAPPPQQGAQHAKGARRGARGEGARPRPAPGGAGRRRGGGEEGRRVWRKDGHTCVQTLHLASSAAGCRARDTRDVSHSPLRGERRRFSSFPCDLWGYPPPYIPPRSLAEALAPGRVVARPACVGCASMTRVTGKSTAPRVRDGGELGGEQVGQGALGVEDHSNSNSGVFVSDCRAREFEVATHVRAGGRLRCPWAGTGPPAPTLSTRSPHALVQTT